MGKYKEIKNDYKEIKKDAKKIPKSKRGPIILVIIGLIVAFGLGFWVHAQFFHGPLIEINWGAGVVQDKDKGKEEAPEPQEPTPCTYKNFEEYLDKWEIDHYNKPDKNGFYCPRSSWFSGYTSPDIWYKDEVPTLFNSIELRYQSRNKNNSTDNPAAFIFSVEEAPRILRFYITESNSQLVGFQKISIEDPNKELDWEEPGRELTDPIQYGTEVNVKIKIIQKKDNKVTFYFYLDYISARTGEKEDDTFEYDVDLPDPTPDSEHSKIKIGFGTFEGDCIKLISYKICY